MDKASPRWPAAPVPVNGSEAVIEAFWDGTFAADRRWAPSPHEADGPDGPYWRSHHGHGNELCWSGTGSIELTRSYELSVRGYSRLSLAVRLDDQTRLSMYATVDGCERAVVENQPGRNRKHEYAGPLRGERLERVRIVLRAGGGGNREAWFRWLLVGGDEPAWEAPADPFARMIASGPLAACEPGLGLLFDAADLERMRQVRATTAYAAVAGEDASRAVAMSTLEPAATIRQHWLYSPDRFGRDADERVDMADDGMALAIEGLLTGNTDYLRRAARYAVAMAHMEHWSEGFTDRFPGSAWRHNAFAPNVATIKASYLLDLAWHALTPAGRALIRGAIRDKGLPYIEPYVARGHRLVSMNQGVRFMKGAILGTLATADDPRGAATRAAVAEYIDRLSGGMMDQTRADGTYVEGNTYGLGTLGSTFAGYHAAARCLGVPARELVFERALDCLRFSRDIDQTISPLAAAFAAGVLGDGSFRDQCVPSSALADVFGKRNWAEFGVLGMDAIWARAERTEALPPPRRPLSAYRDGGWVFLRNGDAAQPQVTLESGLWDPRGHTWKRKNAIELSGWGEPLLLHRHHVAYLDSRYEHTARTAAYNTLTPAGRSQDEGRAGAGARLLLAADAGVFAAAESDAASAWESGVEQALRRLLLIRPDLLIVDDTAVFGEEEPAVLSWHSLTPWRVDGRSCAARTAAGASVRVTTFARDRHEGFELKAAQDAVHRTDSGEHVPAWRAALTTPAGRRQRLLSVVQVAPPGASLAPAPRRLEAPELAVEVSGAGGRAVRAACGDGAMAAWGCSTDGLMLTTILDAGGAVAAAAALGGTWLATARGRVDGSGLLTLPAKSRPGGAPS